MPHDTVVLIIVLVTVAYLASMGLLYWRYRKASDRLAEELRRLAKERRNQRRLAKQAKQEPAPEADTPDTDSKEV